VAHRTALNCLLDAKRGYREGAVTSFVAPWLCRDHEIFGGPDVAAQITKLLTR
jgi:hypothetical protein